MENYTIAEEKWMWMKNDWCGLFNI